MIPERVGLHSLSFSRKLLIILSAMLVVSLSIASVSLAGENLQGNGEGTLCVEGSVIDWQEQALGAGWVIAALPAEDPTLAQEAVTDANGQFRFDGLIPGLWLFAIDTGEGAPLPGYSGVTPEEFQATLEPDLEGCGMIRFKLEQLVTVIVIKINELHERLAGWTIRAIPGTGNTHATTQETVTDAEGQAVFELRPGNWIFEEIAPAGVTFTPIVPTDTTQELNAVYRAEGYLIRFKNRIEEDPRGCIIVNKNDQFATEDGSFETFGLADWHIQVQRADGTIAAEGRTDAEGTIQFTNLPLGPYTVVEETRDGWAPVTPTEIAITLADEECRVLTFVNEQVPDDERFCIEGRKIDQNGGVGLPGFRITARPLDAGGALPTDAEGNVVDGVTTDGFGMYRFYLPSNDYRVPGSFYEVCEELQDGWINVSSTCHRVQIWPEGGMCEEVPDFVNRQEGSTSSTRHPATHSGFSGTCRIEHTVQRGESLYGIGNRYGVSPQAMLDANPFVRRQKHQYVYTGQTICVP